MVIRARLSVIYEAAAQIEAKKSHDTHTRRPLTPLSTWFFGEILTRHPSTTSVRSINFQCILESFLREIGIRISREGTPFFSKLHVVDLSPHRRRRQPSGPRKLNVNGTQASNGNG